MRVCPTLLAVGWSQQAKLIICWIALFGLELISGISVNQAVVVDARGRVPHILVPEDRSESDEPALIRSSFESPIAESLIAEAHAVWSSWLQTSDQPQNASVPPPGGQENQTAGSEIPSDQQPQVQGQENQTAGSNITSDPLHDAYLADFRAHQQNATGQENQTSDSNIITIWDPRQENPSVPSPPGEEQNPTAPPPPEEDQMIKTSGQENQMVGSNITANETCNQTGNLTGNQTGNFTGCGNLSNESGWLPDVGIGIDEPIRTTTRPFLKSWKTRWTVDSHKINATTKEEYNQTLHTHEADVATNYTYDRVVGPWPTTTSTTTTSTTPAPTTTSSTSTTTTSTSTSTLGTEGTTTTTTQSTFTLPSAPTPTPPVFGPKFGLSFNVSFNFSLNITLPTIPPIPKPDFNWVGPMLNGSEVYPTPSPTPSPSPEVTLPEDEPFAVPNP